MLIPHRILFLGTALLLLSQLSGCAQRQAFGYCAYRLQTGECYQERNAQDIKDVDISARVFAAADALLRGIPSSLNKQQSLLSTTLADINDLDKATAFGRLLGEQLGARFAQRGYTVVEAKFRDALLLQEDNGEFMLSREIAAVQGRHALEFICTGTYAVAEQQVFVTLKLLHLNGVVLASEVFSLPLGPDTLALLHEPA